MLFENISDKKKYSIKIYNFCQIFMGVVFFGAFFCLVPVFFWGGVTGIG